MLLESQGISACRNKCASSSMSVWEGKSVWGGAIHSCAGPAPSSPPVPPSCSKGCLAAAERQQLDTLPQYIACVQIKQQHKQGVGSKYDLSAMTESH